MMDNKQNSAESDAEIAKKFDKGALFYTFAERELFPEFIQFYKDVKGASEEAQFRKLKFGWDAIPPGWDHSFKEGEQRGPFGYMGTGKTELHFDIASLSISFNATNPWVEKNTKQLKSLVMRPPGENGNYGVRPAYSVNPVYESQTLYKGVYKNENFDKIRDLMNLTDMELAKYRIDQDQNEEWNWDFVHVICFKTEDAREKHGEISIAKSQRSYSKVKGDEVEVHLTLFSDSLKQNLPIVIELVKNLPK
jgi:hypothetical protein